MTGLELVLAIVGVGVTTMVVVAMILIVPGGVEAAPAHHADPVPPDPEPQREPVPRYRSGPPSSTMSPSGPRT